MNNLFGLAVHPLAVRLKALVVTSTVLLCLVLSTPTGNDVISLATQDGFELIFSTQTEKFSSLEVPGYTADLSQKPDLGVYLYDPTGTVLLDASAIPVKSYHIIGNSLYLTRENSTQEIKTKETWTAYERHIELETTITHIGNSPMSRAIEACVQLPLDLVDKQWHHHLHQSETIQTGSGSYPYQILLTKLVDIETIDGDHYKKSDLDFNLHGLNLIGDDTFGLALAIHPEKPTAYYVRYDATRKSYDACFHLGIYKDHVENTNSVVFNLAFFFPDDPEWGLRSALQKYVSIYPESFVGGLEPQSGMVVGGHYSYDEYPDPEEFHIGAMWNGFKAENVDHGIYSLVYLWPTGFIDRGMKLTASSAPNGPDSSWEADITACLNIYSDYDQGQNPFEETCTGQIPFTQCTQTNPKGRIYGPVWGPCWITCESPGFHYIQAFQVTVSNAPNYLFDQFSMYEPFSNSMLQDESGGHLNAMTFASAMGKLDWEPDYKRCYFDGFNPDPGLEVSPSIPEPGDDAPTETENFGHLNLEIAKRILGLYSEHPMESLNGAAVDTVGFYLRQDFNARMLQVASSPLGYDRSSRRVVALEHLNLLAFLKALRASLPPDAPLSMNGYPISGILGQEIDFFMTELSQRYRNGEWIDEFYDEDLQTRLRRVNRIRISAYQRPITFWVDFDRAANEQALLEQIRQYLPFYTSQGIYIKPGRYGYEGQKSFFSEKPQDPAIVQEYKKHLDAVHALTVAGWEPVPFAKPVDEGTGTIAIPDVIVERFGKGFFTLYNGEDQTVNFSVKMDWKSIGLPPVSVKDWETGQELPFTVSGDTLTVSGLSLERDTVQVLEVQSSTVYLPLLRIKP